MPSVKTFSSKRSQRNVNNAFKWKVEIEIDVVSRNHFAAAILTQAQKDSNHHSLGFSFGEKGKHLKMSIEEGNWILFRNLFSFPLNYDENRDALQPNMKHQYLLRRAI